MYLQFYINENGDKVYTTKKETPVGLPTQSAHPGQIDDPPYCGLCSFLSRRQVFKATGASEEAFRSASNPNGAAKVLNHFDQPPFLLYQYYLNDLDKVQLDIVINRDSPDRPSTTEWSGYLKVISAFTSMPKSFPEADGESESISIPFMVMERIEIGDTKMMIEVAEFNDSYGREEDRYGREVHYYLVTVSSFKSVDQTDFLLIVLMVKELFVFDLVELKHDLCLVSSSNQLLHLLQICRKIQVLEQVLQPNSSSVPAGFNQTTTSFSYDGSFGGIVYNPIWNSHHSDYASEATLPSEALVP
ncbi:hypothetical protein ZIOFF_012032 [Zingiber officinale]|uniref:Nucleolar protein 10 n=1 Tax=Zingiber officinale TaxID=94328 RepID=A0A8J5LTM8_ZINOF|nr:hypothetical protein ZIOFF_012032 [Zingiber officinale]